MGSRWYLRPFNFSGVNLKCGVVDWKFCQRLWQSLTNFTCECRRRSVVGSTIHYAFYWYFPRVPATYHDKSFSASLDGEASVTAFMEVVKFQSMPPPNAIYCKNTRTVLTWMFVPSSKLLQDLFQIVFVEWFNKIHTNPPRSQIIARVKYDTSKMLLVAVYGSYKSKVEVTGDMDQGNFSLAIHEALQYQKSTIEVVVTFNKTRYNQIKKLLQSQNAIQTLPTVRTQKTTTTRLTILPKAPATTKMKANRTTTALMAPSTTYTPELDNGEEIENWRELSSEIEIVMIEPPYSRMRTVLEIRKTFSLTYLLLCQVDQIFMGSPPVNLTVSVRQKLE
ncbi:hypothetical protein EGW08_010975, partial [Elysia chlorotica]